MEGTIRELEFHLPGAPEAPTLALFGLPYIRFIWLLFLAETVFFSNNDSAETVFSARFRLPGTLLRRNFIPSVNTAAIANQRHRNPSE